MYYSTFIVGFEDVVCELLKNKNVSIKKILNGAVLYDSKDNEFKKYPFFNNNFYVYKTISGNIENIVNQINSVKIMSKKHKCSFRVIFSDNNDLVKVDYSLMKRVENKICKDTGNFVNRNKPDIEYWILKRSENITLFMERINKHKSFDKVLNKGELREDLCYFLNYLSNPNENDIYLDAFCGSGAIIKQRLDFGKFNLIFGIDKEENLIKQLRKKFNGRNNIIFKNIDFFSNKFDDNFISKIVTDPPWGFYEDINNIQAFYQKMFNEFERILSDGGRLVLLTACKDEISELNTSLKLVQKYGILVSGKKAGVFVFDK